MFCNRDSANADELQRIVLELVTATEGVLAYPQITVSSDGKVYEQWPGQDRLEVKLDSKCSRCHRPVQVDQDGEPFSWCGRCEMIEMIENICEV